MIKVRDMVLISHDRMDQQLSTFLSGLPPYFKAPRSSADTQDNVQDAERILIQLTAQTRILRLHRPYLSRGYRESEYAKSKEKCVASAKAILKLIKEADDRAGMIFKWWYVDINSQIGSSVSNITVQDCHLLHFCRCRRSFYRFMS